MIGVLGAAWGAAGVIAILSFAVYRLLPRAIEAFEMGLTPVQWLITVAVCLAMAYSEGYRGFQLHFSPRTAARVRYLRDRPHGLRALFAPLFAMGFFHATRRTRWTAYGITCAVIFFVVLVQRLDQPWRGIVDAGVVVGLSWGVLSFAGFVIRALTRPTYPVSPEVSAERRESPTTGSSH